MEPKQDESIPNNDSNVKQIDNPDSPPHSHRDKNGDQLTHHHSASSTKVDREMRDQRVHLHRAHAERYERRYQIQNLQPYKGPS